MNSRIRSLRLSQLLVVTVHLSIFYPITTEAGSLGERAAGAANVTERRLQRADAEPGQWFTGGRDYEQTYYSPLIQINKSNVRRLQVAWETPIDSSERLEATPVVVDGLMFTSGNFGTVYALDARTGVQRWQFT